MIDRFLSLAISMHSNPGVYALLLGSGVSRSSGIPTGWEIVLDLIRHVARLRGESCEPSPETWYETRYSRTPNYSEILNEIVGTSTERMQLLRNYFEPTAEEREEGRKQPTPAHRAAATLIAKGYVRVVVTTNFDRLLEQALSDLGLQPTVVSTSDGATGVLPLAHSRCTIVKVNGDYLDSRLRNTPEELACYEPPIDRLLDQIFDEYGLIVCGWSGEWDDALRTAVERCSSHRFTTFWTARGEIPESVRNLLTFRRAQLLNIANADVFFQELAERIEALESFTVVDPVSTQVAVARLKKYLPFDSERIKLHDLLTAETERVYQAAREERFAPGVPWSLEAVSARLQGYEAAVDVLLALMVCGAYWAEPQHDEILLKCFKRLADDDGPLSGTVVWIRLRRYPALLLLYGMGLAAVARNNYRLLRSLFMLTLKTEQGDQSKPTGLVLFDSSVLRRDLQRQALAAHHTPLVDHLFEILQPALRDYLPDDAAYDEAFDWFEYLLGLTSCDLSETRQSLAEMEAQDPRFALRGPVGRFGWKDVGFADQAQVQRDTEIREGQPLPTRVNDIIAAGFFESYGQHSDKYRQVKAGFDRHIARVRAEWL